MKKVVLRNTEYNLMMEGGTFFCLTRKIPNTIDTYGIIGMYRGCREYLGRKILYSKNDKLGLDTRGLKTGHTYISIAIYNKERKKQFLNSLKYLHDIEEIAGVTKSEILSTQHKDIYIVKGDKRWKDSSWKMMLYSFFIKCMQYKNPTEECNVDYWNRLNYKDNFSIFLSQIKMDKKSEIFDERVYGIGLTEGAMARSGFLSICNGNNEPMRKLLGINKYGS